MITISLCMIVKNEEKVIARCLESVEDIADEIVIVDTGSTDRTKEICSKYTNKIFDFQWIDDFSAARNFSYSKANMEYIMWMDADDVILKEDLAKFKELKISLDSSVDTVMMKYNVGFDSEGNTTFSYYRERLSKRSKDYKWIEPVHEHLEKDGNIINADISITHKKEDIPTPGRNLTIYEKLISSGAKLSPRSTFYYARELYYGQRYEKAAEYFEKFLEDGLGWLEDNISACYHLSVCYAAKQDNSNRLKFLLKSFEYAAPRAEICCELGSYYFDMEEYERAISWYKLAAGMEEPTDNWGFIDHDFYGFFPNIQLCVCYDRIGDIEKAIKYNNKAAEFKPNSPAVIHNNNYFKGIRSSTMRQQE